jgi:hypothetical protein
MSALHIPAELLKVFVDEGLVPANCRSLELSIPADGALVLRYEVFVTTDQLEQLAVIFRTMAQQSAIKEMPS